jgi:hypothetical protein
VVGNCANCGNTSILRLYHGELVPPLPVGGYKVFVRGLRHQLLAPALMLMRFNNKTWSYLFHPSVR